MSEKNASKTRPCTVPLSNSAWLGIFRLFGSCERYPPDSLPNCPSARNTQSVVAFGALSDLAVGFFLGSGSRPAPSILAGGCLFSSGAYYRRSSEGTTSLNSVCISVSLGLGYILLPRPNAASERVDQLRTNKLTDDFQLAWLLKLCTVSTCLRRRAVLTPLNLLNWGACTHGRGYSARSSLTWLTDDIELFSSGVDVLTG